jgi:uncharacterized SAM-binding protein YcdF (DUF218 family)
VTAWELTNVTARLVLPPGLLFLVILVGLALVRTRPRYGVVLAFFGTLALYAMAMPIVGSMLLKSIETPYVDPAADRSGSVIVVLGGGLHVSPEYGGLTVSRHSLERVRYAAHLHKRIAKPVLLTGGNPTGSNSTEAREMQVALREFGVTARWIEEASDNTFESARLSERVLRQAGITRIYLITHAWHMPRAKSAFEESGLEVIPAPMGYVSPMSVRPLDFLPSASAFEKSWFFFREIAGLAWYRLKSAQGR